MVPIVIAVVAVAIVILVMILAIVQLLLQIVNLALEASDLRGRLYVQGLSPVGNTPEEFARAIKEETALWAKVVRERKIEVR